MTCKDCIHYKVCLLGACINGATGTCLEFKDKSRYVELPFPIGTTYYRIVTKRGKVGNPYFKFIREAKLNWYNVESVLSDFGKTVFLSREEAEKALAERRAENDR